MSFLDEENPRQLQPRFLDLSRIKINTEEELQLALCKVSEMKLRPDRLRDDELESITICISSSSKEPFPFLDPVPPSMRGVNLRELSQVDIDWKMLTLSRPETKQEQEIFSRFVELDKLTLRTIAKEEVKESKSSRGGHPLRHSEDTVDDSIENCDEFTYDFFCRQLMAEEPVAASDAMKVAEEETPGSSRKKETAKEEAEQNVKPNPDDVPNPAEENAQQENKPLVKKKKRFLKRSRKRLKRRRRGAKGTKKLRRTRTLKKKKTRRIGKQSSKVVKTTSKGLKSSKRIVRKASKSNKKTPNSSKTVSSSTIKPVKMVRKRSKSALKTATSQQKLPEGEKNIKTKSYSSTNTKGETKTLNKTVPARNSPVKRSKSPLKTSAQQQKLPEAETGNEPNPTSSANTKGEVKALQKDKVLRSTPVKPSQSPLKTSTPKQKLSGAESRSEPKSKSSASAKEDPKTPQKEVLPKIAPGNKTRFKLLSSRLTENKK